jgi:SAM-dependent methyltransferase
MIIVKESELRNMDVTRPLERWKGPKKRFTDELGHYRLLMNLSMKVNDSLIYDLGTGEGGSALALATNPTNNVISWDLSQKARRNGRHAWGGLNVEFREMDFFEEKKSIIKDASIIVFDLSYGKYDSGAQKLWNFMTMLHRFEGILVFPEHLIRTGKYYRIFRFTNKPKEILTFMNPNDASALMSYGTPVVIYYDDGKQIKLEPVA